MSDGSDSDEFAAAREELRQQFQRATFAVGVMSDPESLMLSQAMKRWAAKHFEQKEEGECFYACVACGTPQESTGMCPQCSVAWSIGRTAGLNAVLEICTDPILTNKIKRL